MNLYIAICTQSKKIKIKFAFKSNSFSLTVIKKKIILIPQNTRNNMIKKRMSILSYKIKRTIQVF